MLDDPVLNKIDSHKAGVEVVVDNNEVQEELKNSVDTATQITDRGVKCKCVSLAGSAISNEINDTYERLAI